MTGRDQNIDIEVRTRVDSVDKGLAQVENRLDGLKAKVAETTASTARSFAESAVGADTMAIGMRAAEVAGAGLGGTMGALASAVTLAGGAWLGYQGLQVAAVFAIKDTADEMGKLAQRLGMTTEAVSILRYNGELADVSMGEMTVAARTLTNKVQDTVRGVGTAGETFKAMGISVQDASGQMKSADVLIGEIADKFATYEDGAAKTALAIDLFGRAGEKLIPLLNGGSDALRANADEARKLGVIYGQDLASKSEELNDNISRLKMASEGFKVHLAEGMLPTLVRFSEELVQGTLAAGGFFSALSVVGTTNPFKSYGENLKTVRADLDRMQQDLKDYGYIDEERFERLKKQKAYLEAMQRGEALRLGEGAYGNEGRGAPIDSKTQAPTPGTKAKTAREPKDDLARLRLEARAQEAGLAADTVGEIDKLDTALSKHKITQAEYNRLLGVALDTDRVLKSEQAALNREQEAANKATAKANELIADYQRNNAQLVERIAREAELATMTERQRTVAQALYKVEDDGARIRERILRDLPEGVARTKALADAEAELAQQKERVAAATEKSYDDQATFEAGWQRTFRRYRDDADNAAKKGETLFSHAADAMADAGTRLAMRQKVSFNDIANSFAAMVIRMEMQALASRVVGGSRDWAGGLAGLAGAFLGGGGFESSGYSDLGSGLKLESASTVNAMGWHEGGDIDRGMATFTRSVPAAVFDGAPRYHTGLARGEIAAILKDDETVLTQKQSRQVADRLTSSSAVPQIEFNVINQSGQPLQATAQDSPRFDGERWVIGVVLQDIGRHGDTAKALESTYNLRRSA